MQFVAEHSQRNGTGSTLRRSAALRICSFARANVCSFWRIDALARIGRAEQAREIFEALLARRNPVGLLSEDLQVASGELWGNFPQTYSMVGIINGATRLSAPWDTMV